MRDVISLVQSHDVTLVFIRISIVGVPFNDVLRCPIL